MKPFGTAELMTVVMSRAIRDGDLVAQGVNSVLPSLAIALAKRTHAPDSVCVNIGGGVDVLPAPLPPSSVAPQWMRGTRVIISNAALYGHMFSGRFDVFFSSGVQIDARGRINLSVIGDFDKPKVRLPGAGGLPVVFQTVKRVVLWRARHTPRSLVEEVDFVSATGNVEQLITPLCIFRMHRGRFALAQLFPGVTEAAVREQTGFRFEAVPGGVSEVPPPTDEELRLIEEMDPNGYRQLDLKGGAER